MCALLFCQYSISQKLRYIFIFFLGISMLCLFSHTYAQPDSAKTHEPPPVISINLISFDPAVGDLFARLAVTWPEHLLTADKSLKKDAKLIEKFSTDDSILQINAGSSFSAFNSMLKTTSEVDDAGSQFTYPFDEHSARMHIFLEYNEKDKDNTFITDCRKCAFEGFSITRNEHINPDQSHSFEWIISRSLAIKIFSVCVNILMIVIAASVLLMAIRILHSQEAPQISALGFVGGLIFAMPAVRSLQPRIPPIGILIDYVGFFWAEGLLIAALLIVLFCWVSRSHQTQPNEEAESSLDEGTESLLGEDTE